ncbi:MAG: caspase family protein, partial [Chloroflexota bacterium]
ARQGVGLFYFAGHGLQISNRNFLIPVGADIQREYEVEDQAVDAGSVLAMMETAKARVNIVILDACRNNPFMRNFRSAINGLAPMQAPAGTLVAFSTAPGQTAIDGTGQYGLYTEQLLENLAVPGLKIEDVFKNVRVSVQRASSGRQVPWENTSLTGDFYFRVKVTVEVDEAALRRAQQESVDRAVKQALAQREQEDATRRATQQSEIERAVMAALKKREEEQAAAKAGREAQAAQAAIEKLKQELAELRAVREAESAQAEKVAAAREPAPAAQQAASPQVSAKPVAATPAPQSATSAPTQVALAAPSSRPQPVVNVGGRVERPDVRVGDQWKYVVTDLYTNLKSAVATEVTTVTQNRIYSRSAQTALATADLTAAAGTIDVWDRDWNQLRSGVTEYSPFYPTFRFPLEAGTSWSGNVTFDAGGGITLTHQVTAEVTGWERVTVPAGTFDAVKILLRGYFHATGVAQGTGTVNDVVWYVPSVRSFVRKDIRHYASGYGPAATAGALRNQRYERWELVEFRPN